MNRVITFAEKWRDHFALVFNILYLAISFAKLTIISAALVLAFLFYNASPETTVFQLSQTLRHDLFWIWSVCLAVLYWALFGIGRVESRQVAANTTAAAAGSSLRPPVENE